MCIRDRYQRRVHGIIHYTILLEASQFLSKGIKLMSYLEEFLEKIQVLPPDVNRNMKLIRELDNRARDVSSNMDLKKSMYLSAVKGAKDARAEGAKPENQKLYEEIQKMNTELLSLSQEKLQIANQIFEALDDYIVKMDDDIKKFEEEVKNEGNEIVDTRDEKVFEGHAARKKKKIEGKIESKYKGKSSLLAGVKSSEKYPLGAPDRTDIAHGADLQANANEKRYCYCDGISYGEMIKCDFDLCEREWFHFPCVNLKQKPKGKWYCRDCLPKKNQLMRFGM
eukprot:TRINITY_DN9457_c0_g1_i5.p1 TRINITY_DN9457_c0_g1~~TRINITY_DN9457_c0_g1_i5.p1  ORF type:complete len:281 (+),score=60.45 TRINITY_DN9457_c0_g1_i5:66-908(+)